MLTTDLVRAVAALRRGGVIAYPTEGIYGIGCDPSNPSAVGRVLEIKGRDAHQGFILIADSPRAIERYAEPLGPEDAQRVGAAEPPVTWVVPARRDCPAALTGGRHSIAVRITHHPIARDLCEAFGAPIISTSANRSGEPPAREAVEVEDRLGTELDCVLTGETGDLPGPTEIRDLATGEVLRPGGGDGDG